MIAMFRRLAAIRLRRSRADARMNDSADDGALAIGDMLRRFSVLEPDEMQAARRSPMALVDVLVFCGGALAIGSRVWPNDMFGVQAEFPWLWIAPLLIALRHGSSIGLLAVGLYVGWWLMMARYGWPGIGDNPVFPRNFFVGGFGVVLIAGQFSDTWKERTRRMLATSAYLEERLKTLTKYHFLLRLSHERLEQDLLVKPVTLRETLSRLRDISMNRSKTGEGLPGAQELIQLLGQSCQLERAALYALDEDGMPILPAAAVLGSPSELSMQDPLLRHSLDEDILTHVQSDGMPADARDTSRYLICAPLLPSTGRPIGVLAVEKLPFLALNAETLQLLSVLTDYYADGVNLDMTTRRVLAKVPACPPELALDIVRLHRIRLSSGIDSSLVALVFENDEVSLDILEQVKRLKRGVDISWELAGPKHHALITLLPLAGSAAVEGYLLRIEGAIRNQFGTGFIGSRVVMHTARIGFSPPASTLSHLVTRCAV
jgi:hypothetical protein